MTIAPPRRIAWWAAAAGVLLALALALGFILFDDDQPTELTAADRTVAEAARLLVEQDISVGRLPAEAHRRTREVVLSEASATKRREQIESIWAPSARKQQIEDLEGGMELAFDGYQGFDRVKFVVTEFLDVELDERKAIVDLRGHDRYHGWEGGWLNDQTLHHRVVLWRAGPTDRWYLLKHMGDVDSETRY